MTSIITRQDQAVAVIERQNSLTLAGVSTLLSTVGSYKDLLIRSGVINLLAKGGRFGAERIGTSDGVYSSSLEGDARGTEWRITRASPWLVRQELGTTKGLVSFNRRSR